MSFRRHVCLLPSEDTRPLWSGDPSAGRGVKCRELDTWPAVSADPWRAHRRSCDKHSRDSTTDRRTLAPWETQRSPETLGAQRAGSAPPSRDGEGEPAGPSGGRRLGALSDGDGGCAPRLSFISDEHGKNTNIFNF